MHTKPNGRNVAFSNSLYQRVQTCNTPYKYARCVVINGMISNRNKVVSGLTWTKQAWDFSWITILQTCTQQYWKH